VSCPDWCDSLHPADWDQLVPSGQIIRGHDIAKYPSVPADAGIRCVEVYAYATEYVDGTPVEVGVCVEATRGNLTADQALEVARYLTEAAHKVYEVQSRIERVSSLVRQRPTGPDRILQDVKIHDTELVTFTPSSVSGLDLDNRAAGCADLHQLHRNTRGRWPVLLKKADELDQITTP